MTGLREVADWLVEIGYPFDFYTEVLPPEALRAEIEEAWVRKDGDGDDITAASIRDAVAEEGRWFG